MTVKDPLLLLGKPVADQILKSIQKEISQKNLHLKIVALLIGNDGASQTYVARKAKIAKEIGIDFELKAFDKNIKEKELEKEIEKLNKDKKVTGYIVQLPLPKHIDVPRIINQIDPNKDIDGFHPQNVGNLFLDLDEDRYIPPATSRAVMDILKYYKIKIRGKNVTIIGKSNIVGKPLAIELMNQDATVNICNKDTPNISDFTKDSDIIISAVGKPHLIKNCVKKGVILIDVGFTKKKDKIYGDIDITRLKKYATAYAPVPGGVGPVTIAVLMENTLKAYYLQQHAT